MLVVAGILALLSGFRAIVQVFNLDVWVSTQTPSLPTGFDAGMNVITSGRATVTVKLELIQDGRSEILLTDSVRGRDFPVFNPVPRRSSRRTYVSPVILARFVPGSATLRATAIGTSQWLRTPPPTVRSADVTIIP